MWGGGAYCIDFLLTLLTGDTSFVDHMCFLSCVYHAFGLFIATLWSHDGKGLTSWLSFVMSKCEFVTFPCGILGQVWYLIVLMPDLCPLSYFRTYTMLYNSAANCYKQGVCSKLTKEGLARIAISAAEKPNLYANVSKQIDRSNSQVTVSWQEANAIM